MFRALKWKNGFPGYLRHVFLSCLFVCSGVAAAAVSGDVKNTADWEGRKSDGVVHPSSASRPVSYPFKEDFRGELSAWKIVLDDQYDHPAGQNPRARVVDAPGGAGQKAMRFELTGRPGEFRSEISLPAEEDFQDRWYRASVFVEKVPTNPSGQIVMQWHAQMGKSRVDRDFPNLALWVSGNRWTLKLAYGTPDNIQRGTVDLGEAQPGQWTEWQFHVRWSPTADGSVSVWRNGVHLHEQATPTCYSGLIERTPYFKTGIYRPLRKRGDNSEPPTVVYVKDIEIH
ncbi:polysaccharide lyase [Paludibacterium paludis]|uniref:Polysaccharide lyase-like protein n=1 Tax=Paludibacterium paludis TaxID=1225769 RepID=A0A918UB28_9NEIS|nr:polysaccharide lyase [Paludibacterium paludis]GGY20316.1 hypothetical protein GCM10011289_24860 [Paludibacterium paludis]